MTASMPYLPARQVDISESSPCLRDLIVANKCNPDSCVSPLTLAELASLAPEHQPLLPPDIPLAYGPIRGLPKLRDQISKLYSPPAGRSCAVTAEDVLVTSGAISANHLLLDTLLSKGDHVIVQYPTYGQLINIPRRAGASVSLWRQRQDPDTHTFSLNLSELENLLRPDTKIIILNNPSNPTGLVLSRTQLRSVISLAAKHDILIICDEVFRPLFHENGEGAAEQPPSLLDLGYEKSIVVSSMSKAYALPGIRLGWLAMPSPLRTDTLIFQSLVEARDYTTIAVSQVDQYLATSILSEPVKQRVLGRSREICNQNIAVLNGWLDRNKGRVKGAAPQGAGTCVVTILDKEGNAVDDVHFAETLAKEKGVLAPPASLCFGNEPEDFGSGVVERDLKGGLRIGIVMALGTLAAGLDAIEQHQRQYSV